MDEPLVIHLNIKDIARVVWQGDETGVWFRSYKGTTRGTPLAGDKPLRLSGIPDHLLSALACLMATGGSQPLEFQVRDEPKLSGGTYEAVYTTMFRIGPRLWG
jgi:hypothetical protein